jgi:hypothetical protein
VIGAENQAIPIDQHHRLWSLVRHVCRPSYKKCWVEYTA